MNKVKGKLFAIDFDGTIATEVWPEIGTLIPHADRVIKKIIAHGGIVGIWTCRGGEHEEKVRDFLMEHNIPIHYFNQHFSKNIALFGPPVSPKIGADYYIDDKSIHCHNMDWLEIERMLFGESDMQNM